MAAAPRIWRWPRGPATALAGLARATAALHLERRPAVPSPTPSHRGDASRETDAALPPTSVPHPAGRSVIRWYILVLLTFASFVAYVLRTNMSIAGEHMMADVGLTQVQFGFVLAAFAWGYAAFQFPG